MTEIGEDAFHHCRSLRSITIPDSVTSIGLSAFLYCTNLEVIRVNNPDLLKRAAAGPETGRPASQSCREESGLTTGKGMEESWRGQLQQDIYQIITPEKFLSPIKEKENYTELIKYLSTRYW